jgi:Na+-translocating ferredoxin:NAD+ oxidoreductase subunit G
MTSDAIKQPAAPSSLRLVMTLAIAGLISGVAIIGIYESTLPTITANKARELREAVFKVLPGVTRMQALVYRDGRIMAIPEPDKDEPVIYGGYDDQGDFVGYAMPGAGPGFQDTIALLYGYLPDNNQIVGMEILESRETPGLGDKIYKDAEFVAEFSALSIEPEVVTVKKGTGTRDNQVDAITGATISSKAVVRIINETHVAWAEKLPAPGTEPPFAGEPADNGTGQ